MAVSFPQLDVYYIDFSEESNATVGKIEGLGDGLLKVGEYLARARFPEMSLMSMLLGLGIRFTPTVVKSLTRLINENRFFIITSEQELEQFENACGNDWVSNRKSLKPYVDEDDEEGHDSMPQNLNDDEEEEIDEDFLRAFGMAR